MRILVVVVLTLFITSCDQETKEEVISPLAPSSTANHRPLAEKKIQETKLDGPSIRALARTPEKNDEQHLRSLLTGDETEKLWGTFGLGLNCTRLDSTSTHHFLIGELAGWVNAPQAPDQQLLRTLGWSVGRCGAKEAEDVLRGYLSPDPEANLENLINTGVFGLSALADKNGSLSERTQTALLTAAARERRAEILLPLGRVGQLSDAVGAHILEVVGSLLTQERKIGRRQAIFALGSAGPSAAQPLAQVLLSEKYTPQERAAAAQALGRLGASGQRVLDKTLEELLERGLPLTVERNTWGPLIATLNALHFSQKSRRELQKISGVVLSEGSEREKVPQRRRLIWLRCKAAELLAEDHYLDKRLTTCSPQKSKTGALAQLRVLSRSPLKKKRKEAFIEFCKDDNPVIAQAALRLIPAHPELLESSQLLIDALGSNSPGTVATAAQIIVAYPARVLKNERENTPPPQLIEAISRLLDLKETELPLETRRAVLKAAGAVRALSLKPLVEKHCTEGAPFLAKPAQEALALLGEPGKKCPSRSAQSPQKASQNDTLSSKVTLIIDSDVGELQLHVEPSEAPATGAHFLELVDSGFYDGISIHGSRQGYAVQFGDKNGDGYDETYFPPLPHEVAPKPFQALSFGASAFAPGAQNSQIFVLMSDAPQLDGTRVHLGQAEGPWHLLTSGDVLHSVRRRP